MEADIRVQCLVFIVHANGIHQKTEQSPTCTRKLRSSTAREQVPKRCMAPRTLRSTVSASVPLARAFVLLPKVFLQKHQPLLALFQQNDILVVNSENVARLLVGNDHLEVFEILLDENPSASVNHLYVIAPAKYEYLNLTQLLFPNVKVRKNYESQNTVIRPAVDNVNLKYIKRLLNYGEVYLEFGYHSFFWSYRGTLLHMAIFRNYYDLARSLLRYGSDAHNIHFLFGHSTLHLAARYCSPLIQVLIDKGVSVDIADDFGASPLHYASSVDVVEILLQNGANVNSADKYLKTPLLKAVEGWPIRMMKTLLDYGADVYVKDDRNKSVLELASRSDRPKLLKFMLDFCFSKAVIMSESWLTAFFELYATEWQSLAHDPNNFSDCATVMARHLLLMQALTEHVTMTDNVITSKPLKKFKEELVKISMQKLTGTNISLCNILTMNTDRISCLLRNEAIISDIFWSQDFESQFPIYGTILKYRLDKGRHRRDIQQEAVKICSRLFRHFKSIPDEIQGIIVGYLTTQDVMILKRVCV